MTCDLLPLPSGGSAIVCSSAQRCACGRRATLLCDWKMPARKSGTCDRPLCRRCSTSPAAGKDLCPRHAGEFATWRARRAPAATGAA